MIKRGRSPESFLSHVAYPMYISRQSKRWMTEGASEGTQWTPLNEKYAEWKRINMAGFPGHGMKMLIATGRLAESVIGRNMKSDVHWTEFHEAGGQDKPSIDGSLKKENLPHHFAAVTKSQLHVWTDLEYAKHVNAARNIWKFGDDFNKRLKALYKGWFSTGSVKVMR